MKFSDPNYQILKQYFDLLIPVQNSTQNSFLIGPEKTVVSEGGAYSILYEKNDERGFVGHRFKINEISGNRFKMEYMGLESTFSVASSAFGIGNEMYFRKDSFFHYWLSRTTQDDLYHNYVNQEKTFIFFGKIWPEDTPNKIYSIEFEGLKDYTLKALPQHNQTVNMEEWLKVYWDQVHHEIYNMTKTFWSLMDPREIDIRWLGYISGKYGIEISEEILNELPLREWVENLPYFLKRIGTYNALYVIWKVFLSNTKNKLNIYERWGEWCSQNINDVIDSFDDYNFLEFYGIQPSGGAGDYYYSRYNPDNYPTHTLKSPNVSCGTFKWSLDSYNDFLLFKKLNLNGYVGDILKEEVNVTGYDPTSAITRTLFLSGGSYDGDFIHSTGIQMSSSIIQPSNIIFWGLSNEVNQMFDHSGNYLSLSFEISGGSRYFKLTEYNSGIINSVKTTFSYDVNTPYYIIIDRSGSVLRARILDMKRRYLTDLLETITLNLSGIDSYSILYALNGRRINTHNEWYGKILGNYTDNINYTKTISLSGNPVITPHYKVQIDLSTEPLGDIFDDQTIISEEVINELVKNFEYVRPVSKYSHYEELISPIGQVDKTGEYIPLYDVKSNGYINTAFTGSQFISASDNGGSNTYSYHQKNASRTWDISHNLNSPYVLVQCWTFDSIGSQKLKLIIPDKALIVDNNNIQLKFGQSVNGVASIAGSGDYGVTYIDETRSTSPSGIWSINHSLNTNTPSGYSTPPGPVIFHWSTSGSRIIPYRNDIYSQDILETTWSIPVSGSSIVRRSDYIHNQITSSSKWSIQHNFNSLVIVQCYDRTNYEEIVPVEIRLLDKNNLEIIWAENKSGYAHIIKIIDNSIISFPSDCDLLNVGICADGIGYWKVGTGTSTLFNPFTNNDLESPVTSGTYKSVEQNLNNVFIDFEVPYDFEDVNITEVGLFNYLDQLIMFSRCSGIFKPDGVSCFFHYRITKLESSSSSSSSSSISSSSTSSSSSSG